MVKWNIGTGVRAMNEGEAALRSKLTHKFGIVTGIDDGKATLEGTAG